MDAMERDDLIGQKDELPSPKRLNSRRSSGSVADSIIISDSEDDILVSNDQASPSPKRQRVDPPPSNPRGGSNASTAPSSSRKPPSWLPSSQVPGNAGIKDHLQPLSKVKLQNLEHKVDKLQKENATLKKNFETRLATRLAQEKEKLEKDYQQRITANWESENEAARKLVASKTNQLELKHQHGLQVLGRQHAKMIEDVKKQHDHEMQGLRQARAQDMEAAKSEHYRVASLGQRFEEENFYLRRENEQLRLARDRARRKHADLKTGLRNLNFLCEEQDESEEETFTQQHSQRSNVAFQPSQLPAIKNEVATQQMSEPAEDLTDNYSLDWVRRPTAEPRQDELQDVLEKIYPASGQSSRYHAVENKKATSHVQKFNAKLHSPARVYVDDSDSESDEEDDDDDEFAGPSVYEMKVGANFKVRNRIETRVCIFRLPLEGSQGVTLTLCGPKARVAALLDHANRNYTATEDILCPIFVPTRRRGGYARLDYGSDERMTVAVVVEQSDYGEYEKRYPYHIFLVVPDQEHPNRVGSTRHLVQRFSELMRFHLIFMLDDRLKTFSIPGLMGQRQSGSGFEDGSDTCVIKMRAKKSKRREGVAADGWFDLELKKDSESDDYLVTDANGPFKPWLVGKKCSFQNSKSKQLGENEVFVFDKCVSPYEALLDLQKKMLNAGPSVLIAGMNTVRRHQAPQKAEQVVEVRGGTKDNNAKFTRLHLLHVERLAKKGVRFCSALQQSEDLLILSEARLVTDPKETCILKSFLHDVHPDRQQCPGGAQAAREAADARKKMFQDKPNLRFTSDQMEMVFCGGDVEDLDTFDESTRVRLKAMAGAWPEQNPHAQ